MHYRKTSIVTKVYFPLVILFGLWVILSLCFCQNIKPKYSDLTVDDGLELRIMSFNIRYGTAKDGRNNWVYRRELVYNVIRDYHPDFIGLQEDLGFQIYEIRSALPEYDDVHVNDTYGTGRGLYNAILYRIDRFHVDEKGTFWFSKTPEVPGSRHWGNSGPRICTWARLLEKKSGRAFYIYNVHLDHESQRSRQRSVVLLAHRIKHRKHSDPFVVTGDFNAGEHSNVLRYLKGKASLLGVHKGKSRNSVPMIDTFRVVDHRAGMVGTFNGFVGKCDGRKIDYILVPPGVRVLGAEIVRSNWKGRYPSDHFPVTAWLCLPATPKH